ncbi:hypothetical protein KJ937_05065 [Patescibacteria group bacterium]|nr:hypothetical protein [Patescibacteria group bacterium]MBU2509318.1 hypothetical protein [Patescibacteria group bacterium]
MSTNTLLIIYFIFALAILFAVAFAVYKIKRLFTRPEMYGMTREQVQERWLIIRKTSQDGVMGAKLAVMEADNLLDSALKSMTMPGSTLGERLKVACYKYPKLRSVWWAHKLRNQLVHESSFNLGKRQANKALDEFERALKILNLL